MSEMQAAQAADEANRKVWADADVVRTYERAGGTLDDGERSLLLRIADEVRGRPILDIGVGGGRTTPFLLSLSEDYLGIDYTPEMVAVARRRFPDVRFSETDARDLSSLEQANFALALFSHNGIDAVGRDDRSAVMAAVRSVLAPRGWFLFSSHNHDGPVLRNRPWHLRPVSPLSLPKSVAWSLRQLVRLPRNLRSYRRLAPQGFDDGSYAIAPTLAHRYGLLISYVTASETRRELMGAGFAEVQVFLDSGEPVAVDADLTRAPWLYYLARA